MSLFIKATFKPWKYSVVALLFIIGIGGIYHTNTLVKSRMASAVSISITWKVVHITLRGVESCCMGECLAGIPGFTWIGVGTDGFTVVKEQQIAQGLVSPLVMDPALAHAHSQYMQNLVLRGAVGILALVIFLFYPMKLIIEKAGWGSPYTMIPLSFAVNALSDVPFEHQNTLYLYALSLVFCWCAIEFNTEKNNHDPCICYQSGQKSGTAFLYQATSG